MYSTYTPNRHLRIYLHTPPEKRAVADPPHAHEARISANRVSGVGESVVYQKYRRKSVRPPAFRRCCAATTS